MSKQVLPNELLVAIFETLSLEIGAELLLKVKPNRGKDYYIIKAIKGNNISMINWLIEFNHTWSIKSIDIAAKYGNLEAVKYLDINTKYQSTSLAIDGASLNGHIEIVHYLLNSTSRWTGRVEWLHDNRLECCTTFAMDQACRK
jgi:hypothetical protein